MVYRSMWVKQIKQAWSSRSIVWLSGVRRVGKTTLAKMLNDEELVYRNCDLPSVVRELNDPELFLSSLAESTLVVLDEVHQLPDPSTLLKIAADEHPDKKILATGSSTLAATEKFRDSLTGRKLSIHLCPVLWEECSSTFDIHDLDRRLLRGGLPEPLLASDFNESFYREWFDSFYARDIAELFQLRNRTGFMTLFHLLLHQSGGQLDYTKLGKETGLSRPTVSSYLEALTISHAIQLVSPFHAGGRGEILRRPKCYAFDTGFVCWERGWDSIRESDRGILWEHLVLDALRYRYSPDRVLYWRDKSGKEIDFVVPGRGNVVDLYECKMNPDNLELDPIRAFRSRYPKGSNFVVSPFITNPYRFSREEFVFEATSLQPS